MSQHKSAAEETIREKAVHLGVTLFLVTALAGVILGFVEWGTRDAILRTRAQARAEAFQNVLPEADLFENVDLAAGADTGAAINVTSVEKATKGDELVGYCLSVTSKGYGGAVNLVVGMTKAGAVNAIRILTHSETPGLGARSTEPAFYEQFNNRETLPLQVVKGVANGANQISAISGATITSNAVTDGVNAAVAYYKANLASAN